jgi:hypothetical protein
VGDGRAVGLPQQEEAVGIGCETPARRRTDPKQKVGQFFMLSEVAAVAVDADRNLVQTEQLAEPEIIEIARARRSRSA